MKIIPFRHPFNEHLGASQVGSYLSKYLSELGAKTVVIEEEYVDKNFLIDYAKFYARSFNAPPRFTIRLHFFSIDFKEDGFKKALRSNDTLVKQIQGSYLGFIVVKPIKDTNGEPLIGCTNLRTYPRTDHEDTRSFLVQKCGVSLYGIPLVVGSLPFQTQDQAVAACATTALWTSLSSLGPLFGIPMLSPAEITEKAIVYPGEYGRNFPSSGLNLMQMIAFINSIGLDTEKIKIPAKGSPPDMIPSVIRAYVKAGLPVIAGIRLEKEGSLAYHAVVISGYRYNRLGEITEIYVHDDQIGPYSRVKCAGGDFIEWQNEWTSHRGYETTRVCDLLVPIYPKIRLVFGHIYRVYHRQYLQDVKRLAEHIKEPNINTEFFLTTVNEYKKFLLGNSCINKTGILCQPLPRFLWVIRIHLNGQPILDSLYDGTEVMPKKLLDVSFDIDV